MLKAKILQEGPLQKSVADLSLRSGQRTTSTHWRTAFESCSPHACQNQTNKGNLNQEAAHLVYSRCMSEAFALLLSFAMIFESACAL